MKRRPAQVSLLILGFQRHEKIILLNYLNGFSGGKSLIKSTFLAMRKSSIENIYNPLMSAQRFLAKP